MNHNVRPKSSAKKYKQTREHVFSTISCQARLKFQNTILHLLRSFTIVKTMFTRLVSVGCRLDKLKTVVSSRDAVTAPVGYREGPLPERTDRFCKWLEQQVFPVDWKDVQVQHSKSSFRMKMPFAFEIRTINCLLKNSDVDNLDIRKSLLEFLEQSLQHPSKRNPVFEVHLASLRASVDPVKYRDEIKATVKDYITNSVLSQDAIFKKILNNLASVSREDCLFVKDLVGEHNLSCKQDIIVKCLQLGLVNDAIDLVDDSSEEMSQWITNNMDCWLKGLEMSDSKTKLVAFFKMLDECSISLPLESEKKVRKVLDVSFNSETVSIDDSGICSNCGYRMKGFAEEDFILCSKMALTNILEREDVFFNTTPEEIENFMTFISKTKKSFHKTNSSSHHHWFDCVIDGLNARQARNALVYDTRLKPKISDRQIGSFMSNEIMEDNLSKVIEKCLTLFKGRILLIGRKHMRNMQIIQEIEKRESRITCYFIENISRDDPFMIYSALQSSRTYIVSNDMFRDHKFLMKDPLFGRWLNSRIIKIPKDFALFVPPLYQLAVNVSQDDDQVHIPFLSSTGTFVRWLCSRRREAKFEKPNRVKYPPLFSRSLVRD